MTNVIDAILVRSMMILLMLGSIAGVFSGIALLLRPDWLNHINKAANGWISTRQAARPLGKSFNMEGFFYRYNQPLGIVLMLASGYMIYYFSSVFNAKSAISSVFKTTTISPLLMSGLLDALVLVFITSAVFAMLISLFLIFRPSMLRDFELAANKIISMRRSLKPLEVQRTGLDQFVFRHKQIIGLLLLLVSLYIFVILLIQLIK
jgi:hypothetical protein